MKLTIRDSGRATAMLPRILDTIIKGLEIGPVVLTFGREGKSRDQEAKYHAMIADFQPLTIEGRQYDAEIWKAKLLQDFDLEMKEQGTPLSHPGRRTMSLDGREMIYVRPTSTKFKKAEAANFIEYLYAKGAEYGIKWSERALAIYEEYRGCNGN